MSSFAQLGIELQTYEERVNEWTNFPILFPIVMFPIK